MADASDVDVITRLYAAMAVRDTPAVLALLAPDVVVTQDDRLPWGGRWVGHDGWAEFGAALGAAIATRVTTLAIFATADEVVQMGRTVGTAVATGREFDVPEVHRWQLRDGLVVAAHFAIATEEVLDALNP